MVPIHVPTHSGRNPTIIEPTHARTSPGSGIWHCPAVRRGVALLLGSLALAVPAGAHDVRFFWSVPKVMRATDDVRVRVGTTFVRIDEATTLCNGQGTSMRRNGVRRWRHFLCTYTTRRGLGRDVEFRVHVLGLRRFVVTDTHWVGASR
jgi:hypothetical protein